MIREHWREPRFWWWWFKHGEPSEVRFLVGLGAAVVVLGGGFLVADRLAQAGTGASGSQDFTFVTTVSRAVTVREGGKTLVKRIPVVRRVLVHPQTRVETRTVKGHVVTVSVTGKVVTVAGKIVTVAGKREVRSETVLVPTVKTKTITSSQTVTRGVGGSSTVVVTVPVTTTVREPTTVLATQTAQAPAQTVTAVRTVTESVTVTNAAVTITAPMLTVTLPVTVTMP